MSIRSARYSRVILYTALYRGSEWAVCSSIEGKKREILGSTVEVFVSELVIGKEHLPCSNVVGLGNLIGRVVGKRESRGWVAPAISQWKSGGLGLCSNSRRVPNSPWLRSYLYGPAWIISQTSLNFLLFPHTAPPFLTVTLDSLKGVFVLP